MNRCREKFQGMPSLLRCLSFAGAVLAIAGCGEGPGNPRPPQSPPRPVTEEAAKITPAHLVLPARPVRPAPGMM